MAVTLFGLAVKLSSVRNVDQSWYSNRSCSRPKGMTSFTAWALRTAIVAFKPHDRPSHKLYVSRLRRTPSCALAITERLTDCELLYTTCMLALGPAVSGVYLSQSCAVNLVHIDRDYCEAIEDVS